MCAWRAFGQNTRTSPQGCHTAVSVRAVNFLTWLHDAAVIKRPAESLGPSSPSLTSDVRAPLPDHVENRGSGPAAWSGAAAETSAGARALAPPNVSCAHRKLPICS